jgi:hypothetical protein
VKDTDWKKDSASQQEAPQTATKAGKDVCQPRNNAEKSNKREHHFSFTKMPSAFR